MTFLAVHTAAMYYKVEIIANAHDREKKEKEYFA